MDGHSQDQGLIPNRTMPDQEAAWSSTALPVCSPVVVARGHR